MKTKVKTFKHNPIRLPEITTQEIDGRRYYITPQENKYPSITTLLGCVSKPALDRWRASLGEEAEVISKYACDVGTNLHEVVERYLNNEPDFLSKSTTHAKYMFYAIEPYLNKIDNILIQEAGLYSDVLKVAGRTDCIGEYDGELSIIDFKTSRNEKKEENIGNYFVQGTAYSLMLEEMTGIKIKNIVIIMSTYDSNPLIFKTQRTKHYKAFADILKEHLPKLELS